MVERRGATFSFFLIRSINNGGLIRWVRQAPGLGSMNDLVRGSAFPWQRPLELNAAGFNAGVEAAPSPLSLLKK